MIWVVATDCVQVDLWACDASGTHRYVEKLVIMSYCDYMTTRQERSIRVSSAALYCCHPRRMA